MSAISVDKIRVYIEDESTFAVDGGRAYCMLVIRWNRENCGCQQILALHEKRSLTTITFPVIGDVPDMLLSSLRIEGDKHGEDWIMRVGFQQRNKPVAIGDF